MTEYQKTTPHATGSTRQNGAPAVSDRGPGAAPLRRRDQPFG